MGKFKDKHGITRVEKWAKSIGKVASPVLEIASNVPGLQGLEKISDFIKGSPEIGPEDKEIALQLLEMDKAEAKEITKRWESDMSSDSWLSKNVRPLSLLYLLVLTTVLVIGDSARGLFKVEEIWINLLKDLLITTVVAYFGSRGFEKYNKIKGKP